MNNDLYTLAEDLEELTSEQLANFTEQLLELLTPANKEQLLNSDSLSNNFTLSGFLEEEKEEITSIKIKDCLGHMAARKLYLEKTREFQKKYIAKINSDPDAIKIHLEKKRERNKKYRAKINSDPDARKIHLQKERERNKKYRAKINSDPDARKIHLQKERTRDKKYRNKIKEDPIARKIYLEKKRESNKKYTDKKRP